jgi:hypothetical protein
MRRFSSVSPRFWLARSVTGCAIRHAGPHATLVALYLVTNPYATMLGLYDLPLHSLSHDTGLTPEEAQAALEAVCATGFAQYSTTEQTVWIPEMARYQIGTELKAKDTRRVRVATELEKFERSRFHAKFLERYGSAYGLPQPSADEPPDTADERMKRARELDRLLGENHVSSSS